MVGPVDQLINRWLNSWSDYFVTGFGWNGTSDLGVDRLPSDMGSKMRVVIASRGSGLPTDATDVRLFPGVHLEMVRQIVTSGELLMTVLALVIPGSRVLCHVPLPIALDGELESALVANKRFHSAVRAHVLLKKGFAKVRLFALSALEGPLPLVLVLPHVVHQVALRNELLLANVTRVRLLTVVLHPDVLID